MKHQSRPTSKPAPAIAGIKRRNVPDRKRAFLAAYGAGLSIRAAAKAARINATTHYDWLEHSAEYRERFAAVKARADQALEDKALKRAVVLLRRRTGRRRTAPRRGALKAHDQKNEKNRR
jgi:transposase